MKVGGEPLNPCKLWELCNHDKHFTYVLTNLIFLQLPLLFDTLLTLIYGLYNYYVILTKKELLFQQADFCLLPISILLLISWAVKFCFPDRYWSYICN